MCGSHKSAGGLRTAFSQTGGGLAQHNQRRITGKGGAETDRQTSMATEEKMRGDSKRREGVKGKMTEGWECMESHMEC